MKRLGDPIAACIFLALAILDFTSSQWLTGGLALSASLIFAHLTYLDRRR